MLLNKNSSKKMKREGKRLKIFPIRRSCMITWNFVELNNKSEYPAGMRSWLELRKRSHNIVWVPPKKGWKYIKVMKRKKNRKRAISQIIPAQ